MRAFPLRIVCFFAVFALIALYAVGFWYPHAEAQSPVQVRWLLAHAPVSLYAEATEVFADTLVKESEGHMTLHVLSAKDIGSESRGDVPYSKSRELLDAGQIELSSTYAVANGSDDHALWALGLPFLFKNYDSLGVTLDGATGKKLLDDFNAKTSLHALAFTLSGGFRIIASGKPVHSINDLKGLRIATSGGPIAEAELRAIGAIPVSVDLESDAHSLDTADVDAIETTYSRISSIVGSDSKYLSYILETNHSLFLTTIVAGDAFHDALSATDRAALEKAAAAAALTERAHSIALSQETKAALIAQGSVVNVLSQSDQEKFRTETASVYSDFKDMFDQSLIAKIEAEQR